ncbi:MAG: ATP-dependent nuclease [Candidatus Pacearchaeota archaeon]
MRISRIKIQNFRGISNGEILLSDHNVFVGDNNTGKSTVLEAIDLVLGPERISRTSAIDEHDFYAGQYLNEKNVPIEIIIEVVVVDLNEEQQRHFNEHIEWWDTLSNSCLENPPAEITNNHTVIPALRVGFTGSYDIEEDDFITKTYFLSPPSETGEYTSFKTSDKRVCGFLFLRTLRTGNRALSLERGSLLDIILKLKDKRLQIWEDVLTSLRTVPVAENPDLGVSEILAQVQISLTSFIASASSYNPHLRVSDLTRESLRRILTVFMETGAIRTDGARHTAPFQHQGTGTINILVLSLLSIIAELKQNVIFAMEEPEIAIPPHIQKSIVESVRNKSAQALFTSHSPYVLEEFDPNQIIVLKREKGVLTSAKTTYPPAVKSKTYRAEFRKRFCEALLANKVLITEGKTEYDAFPAASRRLHELNPQSFDTLESLGFSIIDAETDSQIAPLGNYFKSLGKMTFSVFDKQEDAQMSVITAAVDYPFEAPEKNFERIIIYGTSETALRRYASLIVSEGDWPIHLASETPFIDMPLEALQDSLSKYFKHSKGSGKAADLLGICSISEMPKYILETLEAIQQILKPIDNSHLD